MRLQGPGLPTWQNHFGHPAPLLVLFVAALLISSASALKADLPHDREPLPGSHVPSWARLAHEPRVAAATNELRLAIGLPLRDLENLKDLLEELYKPGSARHKKFLSAEEFGQRYGPHAADYDAVVNFARTNGLRVTALNASRIVVEVAGCPEAIEKAFAMRLAACEDARSGEILLAPASEPAVPRGLSILDIQGFGGSQTSQPRISEMPVMSSAQTPEGLRFAGEGPYAGWDFRAAYAPGVGLDGAGQTLAQVHFDGFYSNDIVAYALQENLPLVPVETVLLSGYDGTPTPGPNNRNAEVSMDIQLAMATAPGLEKIIVYTGGPQGQPNTILARIASENRAKQVSCSWAWTGGPSATTDQILMQMAAQGQSFFMASGDRGAYAQGVMDDPSLPNAPTSSPYLTVAGGTELLVLDPSGERESERAWNRGQGTATGGGVSSVYSLPSWQQGIVTASNAASGSFRNVPDVAAVSENVLVLYNNGGSGTFGGTSCAAPIWAGIAAMANQQAEAYGLAPVGFLNPSLYEIAAGPGYATTFHDIVSGNNTNAANSNRYFAVAGYDLCTGLGTPQAGALIQLLAAPPDALILFPSAGFVARGLIGGPFGSGSSQLVLSNHGPADLEWSAGASVSWLVISTNGGSLGPGQTQSLLVKLSPVAESLPAGLHQGTLYITNLISGLVQTRAFGIQVEDQLIHNGGFESGSFAPWVLSGSTAYNSVSSSAPYVHTGGFGGRFGPSGGLAWLDQSVGTVPSEPYLLSFWLRTPTPGKPNQFHVLWNGAIIFSVTNASLPQWTNVQLHAESASSITGLRFGFRYDTDYFGFDDVVMIPAPRPAAFVRDGAEIIFHWKVTPGRWYAVLSSDSPDGPWVESGLISAAGTTATSVQPVNSDQRYFKLRLAE